MNRREDPPWGESINYYSKCEYCGQEDYTPFGSGGYQCKNPLCPAQEREMTKEKKSEPKNKTPELVCTMCPPIHRDVTSLNFTIGLCEEHSSQPTINGLGHPYVKYEINNSTGKFTSMNNLTLKQALESGRDFKRAGDDIYSDDTRVMYTKEQAIACDYELRPAHEEKVTITRRKLEFAFTNSLMRCASIPKETAKQIFSAIVKELGFKG